VADIVARVDPRQPPKRGARVTITIRPDALHLFSPQTGERVA
jgi:multiple sugar transport system ATP-binding protein